MRALTLSILLLWTINTNAQETYTSIKGTLIDRKSRELIPFASIYIKGKSIGTVSSPENSTV